MYNQSAFDADKRALKSQEQINDDMAQDIAAERAIEMWNEMKEQTQAWQEQTNRIYKGR